MTRPNFKPDRKPETSKFRRAETNRGSGNQIAHATGARATQQKQLKRRWGAQKDHKTQSYPPAFWLSLLSSERDLPRCAIHQRLAYGVKKKRGKDVEEVSKR